MAHLIYSTTDFFFFGLGPLRGQKSELLDRARGRYLRAGVMLMSSWLAG